MIAEHNQNALPADVIAALQQGNKIEAIKRLSAVHGLQLVDAKNLVDRYIQNDLALKRKYQQQAEDVQRWLWLAAGAGALVLAYWWF